MDGDARKNCRRTVADVGPSSAKEPQRHGKRGVLANHGASFMLGEWWSELENRE